MKANAPEKIYLSAIDLEEVGHLLTEANDRYDVEYIRTDVFIEKACEYLKEIFSEYENLTDYNPTNDFKNYMKGE